MTEPSQYFKGRTVQEQMDEVIGYVDQRSAEVAVNAIASDVAQVHQDMLDADADATAAAASAAAAAGTLANAVKKTGEASQSIAGDIAVAGNLTGGTVTVPAPVNNTDAASKKYVDDQDALDVHLAGAQTITGIKDVPLEATGTASNQIANSQKVKNELDNYSPMVRTTGNQTVGGIKTFNSSLVVSSNTQYSTNFRLKNETIEREVYDTRREIQIMFLDKNDKVLGSLILYRGTQSVNLIARLFDKDGVYHDTTIASYTDTQ